MIDDVWEPWQPVEGQRVRIRLSAECRVTWPDRPHDPPHLAEFDGLEGEVKAWAFPVPTHRYAVVFDAPIAQGDRLIGGAYFAAIELEPVPA